jgi:hypothetical protein
MALFIAILQKISSGYGLAWDIMGERLALGTKRMCCHSCSPKCQQPGQMVISFP